jgi:23S rRNA (cytosine1962-C5)-methyltransferase
MEKSQGKLSIIVHAFRHRADLIGETQIYRLFNGFYEGIPDLVIDRYGPALVIFNHTESSMLDGVIQEFIDWVSDHLDGVDSVLLKKRQHPNEEIRNGVLISGESLPKAVIEYGVHYALDLTMNQDASFYPDTRELRRWLRANGAGKRVLNTFAYTGSLGVAAGASGAARVVQTDLNRQFLNLAEKSWQLNDLAQDKCEIIVGDFFRVAARLRHAEALFDIVILDPPFFSTTEAGKVDLEAGTIRLINKVRPLVAHEGFLVAVNNALFLSGEDYMMELQALCESPYLQFEDIIPVPPDVTGTPETVVDAPPVDPAPFNHPTKIALLRAFRKDERQ